MLCLNCNFLYKETLAAFDNGVILIVMRRHIVSLKYGSETGKFWFIWQSGSQLLKLRHTDESEQKAADVEVLCGRDCGLWVLKGTIIPSRCGCNFLTGTAFPLVPPKFKNCINAVHWLVIGVYYQSLLSSCDSFHEMFCLPSRLI